MERLPLEKRFVGSTHMRALAEMSARPRAFSFARGPGVGDVGLGMPQDADTNGAPTPAEKRGVNVRLIVRSTACCRLTT
jgi:hypothetical protein